MHGINSVPGGVDKNLSRAECDRLLNGEEGLPSVDEIIDYAQDGLQLFYDFHEKNRSAVDGFANVPALNMSLVDADGNVDYYHGALRIVDENKRIVGEFDYHDYLDHFSEAVEEWSYMKFPFLKDLGRRRARSGGPACADECDQDAVDSARAGGAGAVPRLHRRRPNNMTLHTNWARTIEVLHAAEVIEGLLRDPDLQNEDLIVTPAAGAWVGEGVGVVEAPRGTLLHHYRAGPDGDITFANLIVATTHNNQVLNRTVRSVAEDYLVGRGEITEGMMNAIEVGIRAFDPCLSCATHAFGQMPLIVTVRDAAGLVINERVRSGSGS